jgi:RimJ/RimL family protein N-acetyltransferase
MAPLTDLPVWAIDQPDLHGDGVLLRPLQDGDLDAIVGTARDPEFARWTGVPMPYERVNAVEFVAMFGRGGSSWLTGLNPGWAMSDPEDPSAYWGAVDLRFDGDGGAEIGFGVSPWARGRGVCTAAVREACRWGFEEAGLARIVWHAHTGNHASRRVAEKVGFQIVGGVLRQAVLSRGVRQDVWVADLLPADLVTH